MARGIGINRGERVRLTAGKRRVRSHMFRRRSNRSARTSGRPSGFCFRDAHSPIAFFTCHGCISRTRGLKPPGRASRSAVCRANRLRGRGCFVAFEIRMAGIRDSRITGRSGRPGAARAAAGRQASSALTRKPVNRRGSASTVSIPSAGISLPLLFGCKATGARNTFRRAWRRRETRSRSVGLVGCENLTPFGKDDPGPACARDPLDASRAG